MWNGDLDNIEQVTLYMNTELQKGRSQKEIEMIDFKVNQSVMKNRLTRRGYKKIDNQWILLHKQYDGSNTKVTINQPQEFRQYDNNNTLVITDEKMKNNIINLAKNYDKIMSIVEQYDTQYDKEYDSMTIELPVETIKDFRTSIRINNVVWEQFNKFSQEHKEFTINFDRLIPTQGNLYFDI